MSQIVSAAIKPILLRNMKMGRLFGLTPQSDAERTVMVDATHPITKALMQQLPKLANPALYELRVFLLDPERDGSNSASTLRDIDSWVGLVDAEIEWRKKEAGVAFAGVMGLFARKPRPQERP